MFLLVLFFKVYEHETVWIKIRPYLSHDIVWPDLGLKCMQNLPADKTIAKQSIKIYNESLLLHAWIQKVLSEAVQL